MKNSFFGLAFALITRLGLRLNFSLAIGLFIVAQLIALHMLGAALYERGITAALMFVAMLCAIYLLSAISFWTTAGMDRMNKIIERVASGDLSGHAGITNTSTDIQSGALWRSVAQMTRNLVDIVNQVRASADKIVHGAKEIAAGNTSLSQRTEEQASTLEETSASMEELAATVKQNAESCRRARAAADDASKITAEATQRMRDLARTMGAIESGSRRVAEITNVIESIAFQTNILALNAAVEAARAGEQGRGFAVVAAEVRSLAQRSAEAGKEIKDLIQTSVGNVAQGATLAGDAGATMEKVLGVVQQVNQLISEIAEASAEQSTGVEEISRAVSQLDHVTQQNAALVEEATSAALSFEEEAARLVDVVGTFKVDRMEDRDHAVALVKKAVAHLKAVGVEQAARDFEDPNGGFIEGEFYLFGNDLDGIRVCNGRTPGRRDKENNLERTDAKGKRFVREMIDIAKTKGKGWVDYHALNPATGQVEPKSAYVERVDNILLGCGIYKAGSAPVPAAVPSRASVTRHNTGRALRTAG